MGVRVLGIDIGTTGVRAAIFDASGSLLADASVPCPVDAPEAGWAQVYPEAWWRAARRVLAELAASAGAARLSEVTAIGVVGQAPTLAVVDAKGDAIEPAILWLDTRRLSRRRRQASALVRRRRWR